MVRTCVCLTQGRSSTLRRVVVQQGRNSLIKDAMNATKKILQTYNKEELKEIANHGCQSGVCSQHIYYGDTIQFYETFETNILDELVLNYGYDLLNDLFKDANADLTVYKNHVVWAFIEMVAFQAIEDEALLQPV